MIQLKYLQYVTVVWESASKAAICYPASDFITLF